MGKRSAIEATVGILSAFMRRRTWRQAELGRELDLEPRTLKRHLTELARRGIPLDREDEPPQVYWSMPKNWFPGGVLLEAEDAQLLIGLLCRVPASKPRNTLLRRVSSAIPGQTRPVAQLESVFHGLGDEAPFLSLVSESAIRPSAIHFRYYSAHRGALEWRHASVQRVLPGPPARMVAHCHRSSTLKWFRIDGILDARLDPAVTYQTISDVEVDAYLMNSLDGFAAEDTPVEHRFFVAEPDARWVTKNLIPPMKAESAAGGLRVTCRTTATLRLARFVLGLAPVARAETPELASLVHELATATLGHHWRAKPLHGAVTERSEMRDARRATAAQGARRKTRG
ncbi:MAG TPA: WYL domain-containing protein [Polyangiaceae bacterium]|jgi:predicted DNA-binding transcriptional regulator YafY|nr:WYL domain-containing protein [Polyangiaceae bacterium]